MGALKKFAKLALKLAGIVVSSPSLQAIIPQPIGELLAVIKAAEMGFPGDGTGPQKLAFVRPFAYQAMCILFGTAKGEKAMAAVDKFVSAIVDWLNAVHEDEVKTL